MFTVFPVWVISTLGLYGFHIYLNTYIFDWWAEGNAFLVANTVFFTSQLIMATLTMIEIPIVLRYLKVFRLFALGLGQLYNLVWFVMFVKGIDMVMGWEGFSENPMDMVIAMILFSLGVSNFPVVVLNTEILLKEIQIELFHITSEQAYIDYSLGFHDLWDMPEEAEEMVDIRHFSRDLRGH